MQLENFDLTFPERIEFMRWPAVLVSLIWSFRYGMVAATMRIEGGVSSGGGDLNLGCSIGRYHSLRELHVTEIVLGNRILLRAQ